MQKAESYQEIGEILLHDDCKCDNEAKLVLDNLYDCENNTHKTITIEEINEYLEPK